MDARLARTIGPAVASAAMAVVAGCELLESRSHPPVIGARPALMYKSDLPDVASTAAFDEDVLRADQPVFVMFYMPTCPHCREFAPAANRIKADYAGRVAFYQVHAQRMDDVRTRYKVFLTPTLFVFSGGNEVKRWIGAPEAAEIRGVLDAALAGTDPDKGGTSQ